MDFKISQEVQEKLQGNGLSCEVISYDSQGVDVTGIIVKPFLQRDKKTQFPIIFYNRGGCGDFGAISEKKVVKVLSLYASWGYVVVASQYRGNKYSAGKDEFGGKDVFDVVNLYEYSLNLPYTNEEKVAMIGASRGNIMTFLALQQGIKLKAAVSIAGLTDLCKMVAYRPEMQEVFDKRFGGSKEKMIARSPLHQVDTIDNLCPFQIFHGRSDWRVDPSDAINMAQKLTDKKIPNQLFIYPGASHRLKQVIKSINKEMKSFFNHYLQGPGKRPTMDKFGG